jgi:hypothetical protein
MIAWITEPNALYFDITRITLFGRAALGIYPTEVAPDAIISYV